MRMSEDKEENNKRAGKEEDLPIASFSGSAGTFVTRCA
jgi:hypothetical protein